MPRGRARAVAVAAGGGVNGLPVLSAAGGRWVRPVEVNLDDYFRDNVITGPGAFVLPARTEAEFREAILRKLIIEIAGALPSHGEVDPLYGTEAGRAP